MLIKLNKLISEFNLKINGVLHIGANDGDEFNDYYNAGIKNMIFFEPLKDVYNKLIQNIIMTDNIKSYNIALGNMTGEIDMYVETFNKGMSSSILKPELHLTQYPHIKFDNKETVKIDKLDNIDFDRTLFNMINIDVQGYEIEVFNGAIKTLETINIVYTEVNRDEVYKNCCRVEEVDEFLKKFGFNRLITEWTGNTWGDSLYLKK
jgi:FkbM family methyltransferase